MAKLGAQRQADPWSLLTRQSNPKWKIVGPVRDSASKIKVETQLRKRSDLDFLPPCIYGYVYVHTCIRVPIKHTHIRKKGRERRKDGGEKDSWERERDKWNRRGKE